MYSSLNDKSIGNRCEKNLDLENIRFNHGLTKKVGAIRNSITRSSNEYRGKRSNEKEKKRTSAIKNSEPGKPKNTKQLRSENKNSFGVKKFKPLSSVISRVLNLRVIASTNKNEFVDKRAWLISIQKFAQSK